MDGHKLKRGRVTCSADFTVKLRTFNYTLQEVSTQRQVVMGNIPYYLMIQAPEGRVPVSWAQPGDQVAWISAPLLPGWGQPSLTSCCLHPATSAFSCPSQMQTTAAHLSSSLRESALGLLLLPPPQPCSQTGRSSGKEEEEEGSLQTPGPLVLCTRSPSPPSQQPWPSTFPFVMASSQSIAL